MIIVGLTGSIGMGKTTAAGFLRHMGIPVHDADATVHDLLSSGGGGVEKIKNAFGKKVPALVSNGAINRDALGAYVYENPGELSKLESILHPLVRAQEKNFLKTQALLQRPLVILDIPLLFETGGEKKCDVTILLCAPPFLQKARVLKRPGMTDEKFKQILARQMGDSEKKKRADVIVSTGRDKGATFQQLRRVIGKILKKQLP